MWASPLYVEDGPNGKGVFIAATTGNDVFALDETSGATVWMTTAAPPSTSNSNGCNFAPINPLGILSTPVIDDQTRTIYVAGAQGTASGITNEFASALGIDDGKAKSGWPVNVSSKIGFNALHANQRSALSLVNGIVYIAYGGFVGDCPTYSGRVVAIKGSDPTMVSGWVTGGQGEAIWAAGGMASDGNGIFAITGNNTGGATTHMDSEEALRLTGMASFTRSNDNAFFPTSWQTMDTGDADLGANSPVYLPASGSTPAMLVVISKDGHMYLLDPAHLGGSNGSTPLVDFMVANGTMAIHTVPAAYKTAMGTYVTFSTDTGAKCSGGGNGGSAVMSVLIPPGSTPKPQAAWCNTISGGPSAPIATTTDGTANPIVWIMSGNKLMGYDGDTGATVYSGGGNTDTCTNVRKWTSPIAVKGRIVVGGDGHLCSWSSH
jgi:hypothetical protein